MSRTLRSLQDVEGCCSTTTILNWGRKAVLFLSMFVFWGLGTANAQENPCDPSIDLTCPSNVSISCDDVENIELGGSPSFVVNGCDDFDAEVTIDHTDLVIPSTACSYTIVRTWIVSIPQFEVAESCTQTLSVYDNEGPIFSELNDITVQCIEDVVAPTVTATDACSGDADVTPFEVHTAGVISTCVLTTPIGPGPDGAIWLFGALNQGLAASDYWSWAPGATLTSYDDGTAHVSGTVVNNGDATQSWVVSMWLVNKRDWAQWSALGRSYKNDLNLAGTNYLNWEYYELLEGFSTLTGAGSYAGNILYLSHQPSNYYFGFQKGIAANNRNSNDGLSGWFYYNGWYNGVWRSGHGDLFTNTECTPNNPQLQCDDEVTYFFRATDACGNATITSQTVTVHDSIAPEFTNCPEDMTVECSDELPAVAEGITATDNCDDDVTVLYLGQSEPTTEDGCTFIVTRTWAAFDDCNNRTDCVQTFTIVDTTAPFFTYVPEAVTFECDEDVVREDATASDLCHAATTVVTVEEELIEGECINEYSIVRTFTANDGCGNTATATQTISVVDTTAPVFDPFEAYIAVECTEVESVMAPTATDNCQGEVVVTLTQELLNSGGCLGVLERHYRATDACGNYTDVVMFIAIQDTTNPIVENPADFTVECSEVPAQPEVNAYDNCDLPVTVVPSSEIIAGDCENSYTIIWTWTATDYCENVTVVSTTVTVVDTTNPTLENVPADITIECSDEVPAVVMPTGSDNCDENVDVVYTSMIQPGNCPNNYTIVRMFRAFDNCGNEGMAVQYITVQDTTAPTFEGVAQLSFECDEDIVWVVPSYSDNCQGDVAVTSVDATIEDGSCYAVYTRTYTFTDVCGNSSSFVQTATVVDTTAPSFEGSIVEIDRPCDDFNGTYVSVTDNCNDYNVTFTDEAVSGGCQGRIIRTYTAVDACQNAAQFVQIITLIDEVDPFVTSQTEDFTVECGFEYSTPVVTFGDNCDDELEIVSGVVSEGTCPEVVTYTWTATDNCGNSITESVVVTIVDTTVPTVFAPQGGEFSCDADIMYGMAEGSDLCSEEVAITWSQDTIAGNCPNNYTIVRTWYGTDACGNVGSATTNYNVYDETNPFFTAVAEDATIECDAPVPAAFATAGDNCGTAEVTHTEMTYEGECANSYTIVRTYVATDLCGNTSEATQTITVVDTTAPSIEGIVEIDRPCDDYMGIYVSTSDNCDEEPSLTYVDEAVSGGCQGRIIRTYTSSDNCGNTDTFVQIITLIDEVDPFVTSQTEDFTVECGFEYSTPVVTFGDNCDDELEIVSGVVSEGTCPEVVTYTWTATDNCGNSITESVVVTIVDTTVPTVFAPQDGEYSCDADIMYGMAEGSDLCSEEVAITWSQDTIAGNCPNNYTIVRTWYGTDACGNVGSATTNYYVYDETNPFFTAIAEDATIECDAPVPAAFATAGDNCGTAEVTHTEMTYEGECANSYTIVRTYVATDLCGNTSEATQTITVVDTTAPSIEGIVEIDLPCDNYMGIYVTTSDNCDEEPSLTYVDEAVSGGCQGRIIRTYTSSDDCGNTDTFVQIITLVDITAPTVAEQPMDMTIECGDDVPSFLPEFSDNCDDELSIEAASSTSTEGCTETITRTWTATDNCGNSITVDQVITIVDTTAPVWYSEGYTETVSCGTAYSVSAGEVFELCNGYEISEVIETIDGQCEAEYTEIHTFIATDACGNASLPYVVTINYVDNEAPYFTSVPESNEFSCDAIIPNEMPVAGDFCSSVEVDMVEEIIDGECVNSYIIVRTYTATDACGNVSEPVSVSYYIYDNTNPTIETELVDLSYDCPVEIVPATVVVSDNCSEVANITVTPSVQTIWSDDCGNGVYEVSYFVQDECGNFSEASYSISIYDEEAPVLSETPENLVLDCEESLPAAPVVSATDNCTEIVTVEYSEEIIGEMPAEGSIADCNLLTPVRPAGNPCNYAYDWAMALFAMPSAHRYYQVQSGELVQYPNGTVHVVATMVNAMNNANGFYVDVTFANALDWAQWSTQSFPTGFKADCGGEDENHQDWIYYLLQAGEGAELVGFGGYTGSAINLVHAPSNNYFGFQLGNGANNYNGDDNGFGGWFTYNGVFLVDGQPIMSGNASGAGDFAFNLDCCPDYSVVRTWSATDCTGNTTVHTQTITWGAANSNDPGFDFGTEVETAEVVKGNIDIVAVYPNPSVTTSDVKFVSKINDVITLDVMDATGRVVAKMYSGKVEAGQVYKFTLNTSAFNNGLYQVRLMSSTEVATKQLQIVK